MNIDKQALIEAFCRGCALDCAACDNYRPAWNDERGEVDYTCSIISEAEPIIAEWVLNKDDNGRLYTTCSRCRRGVAIAEEDVWGEERITRLNVSGLPFCPNCGASMKGVQANERANEHV